MDASETRNDIERSGVGVMDNRAAQDWTAPTLTVNENVPLELDPIPTPEEEQEIEEWLDEDDDDMDAADRNRATREEE